jgi:hypothetical protein
VRAARHPGPAPVRGGPADGGLPVPGASSSVRPSGRGRRSPASAHTAAADAPEWVAGRPPGGVRRQVPPVAAALPFLSGGCALPDTQPTGPPSPMRAFPTRGKAVVGVWGVARGMAVRRGAVASRNVVGRGLVGGSGPDSP